MPLVKPRGITVTKMADILGTMIKDGNGELIVCIDNTKNGMSMLSLVGRGDIGIASDGRKVLVLRRDDTTNLAPTIQGVSNAG